MHTPKFLLSSLSHFSFVRKSLSFTHLYRWGFSPKVQGVVMLHQLGSFPTTRLRRLRQNTVLRNWAEETHPIRAQDLIMPLFITEGPTEAIAAMPGLYRYNPKDLLKEIDALLAVGLQSCMLFPVIDPSKKSAMAEEAYNPDNLICKSIAQIKAHAPEMIVMADVALDPYTIHGHDGITNADHSIILNDETVQVLVKQALCFAQAGADVVAPSEMMDGRILAIRSVLEHADLPNTLILSYSAKYTSALYGPFRSAVGSQSTLGKKDKRGYLMNPANVQEALRKTAQDIQEGADLVIVKPATIYLDIIRAVTETFSVPVFAYHVSGEYAMLKAVSQQGWLDEKATVLETLLSIKRAGTKQILSYYAKEVAQWLKNP